MADELIYMIKFFILLGLYFYAIFDLAWIIDLIKFTRGYVTDEFVGHGQKIQLGAFFGIIDMIELQRRPVKQREYEEYKEHL